MVNLAQIDIELVPLPNKHVEKIYNFIKEYIEKQIDEYDEKIKLIY